MARRGGMRFRQPHVQWHESGLGPESNHRQQEQNARQSLRVNALCRPDIEIHGTGLARQQQEKCQQKGRAQMRRHKINPARLPH